MTNRGFTLYQLTALAREMHRQGHTSVDCTATEDLDAILGETHDSHPTWGEWSRDYHALVAAPVRESPQCPECFDVAPVASHIPGRAMCGSWVGGATIVECGACGHRVSYKPDRA